MLYFGTLHLATTLIIMGESKTKAMNMLKGNKHSLDKGWEKYIMAMKFFQAMFWIIHLGGKKAKKKEHEHGWEEDNLWLWPLNVFIYMEMNT
jgi:hypothetical protein